jgi:hypothetical protein
MARAGEREISNSPKYMKDQKGKNIQAPRTTVYKGKGAKGPTSFEAYFLRDLYSKGKIDDRLIKQIVEENGLDVRLVNSALKALKQTGGAAIPRGTANFLRDLASIVADAN